MMDTNFEGYQVQPNGRTVQGEIEKVLSRMHKGEFFAFMVLVGPTAVYMRKGKLFILILT